MPVLSNTKHERFAQLRAEGMTATDAYVEAGFAANDSNAARLNGNERIANRVAEILAGAAKRTEITVAGITEKLLAIAEKAEVSRDAPMLAVARASYMDAAKLNGLVVDKSKVESVNRTALISDRPMTEDEWAAESAAFN